MNEIRLQDTPIDDDQFQSILFCVDKVERLILNNCNITNLMVEEMAKRIKERKEPVNNVLALQ